MSLNQPNKLLVKFFAKSEYKQAFLNGQVFCSTPAYYRKANKVGVADRCESAIYSHYNGFEPDDDIRLAIGLGKKFGVNKINLKDCISFILRQAREVDSWLNCWYLLDLTTTTPNSLADNLDRMLKEFGEHTVLLDMDNFGEFLQRIKKHSTKAVDFCTVQYTENPFEISKYRKLSRYSYQKEFRFMFGECDFQCIEPYDTLLIPGGFRDLFMDGFWLGLDGCDDNRWPRFFK
ncbi:hypothetical protein LNQ51_16140 [Yersinia ruckeri]|uniref:hypothetical protein n=1 Tax=Yersinia ruckeri TaxID=29486 RepID=UPI0020BDBE5B|nr:hypothetical protein [Yersinia ruckeri]MCK8586381.1 hypothetical protein [Yersinia ruckeri]